MENSYELVNIYDVVKSNSNYRSRSNQIITNSLSAQHVSNNISRNTSNSYASNAQNDSYRNENGQSNRNNNKQKKSSLKNSTSEFDLVKLAKKMDYDYTAGSLFRRSELPKVIEMKMRSVEHTCHNTDLVIHAYIKKVI